MSAISKMWNWQTLSFLWSDPITSISSNKWATNVHYLFLRYAAYKTSEAHPCLAWIGIKVPCWQIMCIESGFGKGLAISQPAVNTWFNEFMIYDIKPSLPWMGPINKVLFKNTPMNGMRWVRQNPSLFKSLKRPLSMLQRRKIFTLEQTAYAQNAAWLMRSGIE